MNATATLRPDVTAAPRVVTVPCARKWPVALDGRSLRPIRNTWHPHLVRRTEDSAPYVVPIVSCPRCARTISLVTDADVARVLQAKARPGVSVRPTHDIAVDGTVSPELRCGCGWFGPVVLGGWNGWQTLYCAMVLDGRDPLMRALYTHAADEIAARQGVAKVGRRIVSLSPVIRNEREGLILP